jgi:hypothetical protein
MNQPGVRAVGKLFREQFDQLGFQTRWIELPPEMQRAGHLLAERPGTPTSRGKRLLLLGHLDTVFEPGSTTPAWEPQLDADGTISRIKGQGVSDMKGGDVVIVEALRALQRVGALDSARIAVMLTGDEEEAGNPKSISRGDMVNWPSAATSPSASKAASPARTASRRPPWAGAPPPSSSWKSRRARPLDGRVRRRAATAPCTRRRASSTPSASRSWNRA